MTLELCARTPFVQRRSPTSACSGHGAGPLGAPIGRGSPPRYTRAVPSIKIDGPYAVYFTSHDRGEPPHVHIDRENLTAKLWLHPVRIAFNLGFSRHELRVIERMITDNEEKCLRAWNEYFGT